MSRDILDLFSLADYEDVFNTSSTSSIPPTQIDTTTITQFTTEDRNRTKDRNSNSEPIVLEILA
ncbi:3277_t:CDS:1, partial [Paraglomus occultum]